jgi:hypothetical protein
MNTEIITSLSECQTLWEKFRKDTNIWTEWEIVLSFFHKDIYTPYFILMKDDEKEIGLITLWLDLRDNKYTHFGGERMENRTFWVDEEYYQKIRETLPNETYLFDMNGEQIEKIMQKDPKFAELISERDKRFFLNLEKINSLEDYLARFGKKHKKNLLRDIRLLESLDYKLKWTNTNHIERFVELSKARFEEESDFHDEINRQEMDSFTTLMEKKGMLNTLLIEINNKIEAAELAVIYKDKYYVINGGYNPDYRNLGKLLIIEHIKKAIELKAKEIDFLVGDSGWKELWNLDIQECLTIKKIE